jgi:hypothetical protein
LAAILCPPGSGLELVTGPIDAAARSGWVALPSVRAAKTLIPIRGAPASAALTQFNDSMSQYARLRKWLVGQAARFGAGRLSHGRQVAIVGNRPRSDLDLLGGVLPDLFGEPIVTAVMLGELRRPNAKPILQISRTDGHVLAYAKLGWNELTRDLVANEAATLTSWAERPPRTFRVPRPLAFLDWNGGKLLVVEPVPHHLLRRGPRAQLPPTDIVREVAALSGEAGGSLSAAPSVRRLMDDAARSSDDRTRSIAVNRVSSVLERVGDRSVAWGTSHGDWGPWNMSRSSSGLYVWDWERTAAGVPIGTDVLHFCFQSRAIRSRRPLQETVARSLAAADGQLAELGIERNLRGSLMDLYLVEVLLRLDAGRMIGVAVDDVLLTGLAAYLERDRGDVA